MGPKGFVPLAFPTNQFKQEYVDNAKIKAFVERNYASEFPLFARIDVNGDKEHPVYTFLKDALPEGKKGKNVRHNFAKFLCDRNGVPVKRYDPSTKPLEFEEDILELLEAEPSSGKKSRKK